MKKTLCSIAIVGSLFTTSALAQETGNKGIPSLTRSQGALKRALPLRRTGTHPALLLRSLSILWG